MSIHMLMQDLDVCAILDSRTRRGVLPLHHYNAIIQMFSPPYNHQSSKLPVLGEACVPVQINDQQVGVHFLVADIAADETILSHP